MHYKLCLLVGTGDRSIDQRVTDQRGEVDLAPSNASFQSEPSLFPREHVRASARVARMAATGKVDLLVIGTVSMDEVRARLIPVQDALHRRISVTIYSFEQYRAERGAWSGLVGKVLRGKRVFLLGDDEDFRNYSAVRSRLWPPVEARDGIEPPRL